MAPPDARRLMAAHNARKLSAADELAALAGEIDAGWMCFAGTLVFFMHAGFAFLEGGSVKPRNRQSILLKNLSSMALSAVAWFTFGYGIAFGEDSNSAEEGGGVIGTDRFFAGEDEIKKHGDHQGWFFQWTFCATAATIVSGALAERCKIVGFLIFAFYLCAFSYPVVVHWGWGGGWFSKLGADDYPGTGAGVGYMDFAGSGLVHMFGGLNAIVAAAIVGPRINRFEKPDEFMPSNPLLILLGTFFLWFGWYGFNGGSTFGLSGGNATIAARCCITTTCAAAAGALVILLIQQIQGKVDLSVICNGILGGLVGITAGCSNVEPFMAFIIGAIGALFMWGGSRLLEKLKLDDPIGAFPVHGAGGFWGVLAAGLFDLDRGAFYLKDGQNGLFAPNLIGVIAIAIWAVVTAVPIVLVLKLLGLLRVSEAVELDGMDNHEFIALAFSATPKAPKVEIEADADGQGV